MKWSRAEQIVILFATVAVLAGSLALISARRPAPPIRIFERPAPAELVVQVDGAVLRPGLYRLRPEARVADAISAAGGPAPAADLSALNRARLLRDGERLTVPRLSPNGAAPAEASRLDLNAATAQELEALPGIGPVLARRITTYRTAHGPFQRVEDLLQVEGVGPRLVDRLRHQVMVR